MLKALIPSFPLSATISPLTQMALLAISRAFFWLAPGSVEPLLWCSLEGVLSQVLAFTMSATFAPIPQHTEVLWSYSLFSPVVLVNLDLEETGWF